MVNICLCDDDQKFINQCKKIVIDICKETDIVSTIEEFNSGEDLILSLGDKICDFDIYILDMVMSGMNGIQTAKTIREKGYDGFIIFLTSSKEFVLESFEAEPLNYILKSEIESLKFKEIIAKTFSKISEHNAKRLFISNRNRTIAFHLNEVIYIESMRNHIIVHTVNGNEKAIANRSDIALKIKNDAFIRNHKSYIVNLDFVKKFNRNEIYLKNEEVLPIGKCLEMISQSIA